MAIEAGASAQLCSQAGAWDQGGRRQCAGGIEDGGQRECRVSCANAGLDHSSGFPRWPPRQTAQRLKRQIGSREDLRGRPPPPEAGFRTPRPSPCQFSSWRLILF